MGRKLRIKTVMAVARWLAVPIDVHSRFMLQTAHPALKRVNPQPRVYDEYDDQSD